MICVFRNRPGRAAGEAATDCCVHLLVTSHTSTPCTAKDRNQLRQNLWNRGEDCTCKSSGLRWSYDYYITTQKNHLFPF